MKALRPIVAFGIAVVIAVATASSGGAGESAKLKCKFQKRDVVCRLKNVLAVTPSSSSAKVRRLKPGSKVAVTGKGRADVRLAREAQCFLLARGKRTAIQTRFPSNDFLLQQGVGETICFIQGDRKILVKGQALSARATSAVKFSAVVQTEASNEPVQLRIKYRPGSSVGIAVRSGGSSVRLSNGQELGVGGGGEMRADLTKANTIKPGSVRVESAHFDPVENGFWERGARSWLQLSVETAGSGSGTVVTSPPGINCGDDCDESYAKGTVVTLTARASEGSVFAGWTGCSGAKNRCTVTMSDTRFVTALFAQEG